MRARLEGFRIGHAENIRMTVTISLEVVERYCRIDPFDNESQRS